MAGKLMSEQEKADITVRAISLRKAGRKDEAMALFKSVPMPPFLAKIMKEKVGPDFLLNTGWNMAEAEAAFGQGWLTC